MRFSNLVTSEINALETELNLTDEELEIFSLLAKGWSRQQISLELAISLRTIDRRIRNIKDKMRKIA